MPDRNDPADLEYLKDPVLRLLPEDPPKWFVDLPEPERHWRGRIMLMVYAMGYPEEYAWWHASQTEPDYHVAFLKQQQSVISDEAIIGAVRQRQRADLLEREDALDTTTPVQ